LVEKVGPLLVGGVEVVVAKIMAEREEKEHQWQEKN
jgi:hypothetical protein